MMAARAVYPKRFKVGLRAISLVLMKAVLREFLMQLMHQPIPAHLRNDAGGRDGKGKAVSLYDGIVREGEVPYGQPINEAVIGPLAQGLHSPSHGQVGGTQDIQPIDFLDRCEGHGPDDAFISGECLVNSIPPRGRQFFGIIQPGTRKTAG